MDYECGCTKGCAKKVCMHLVNSNRATYLAMSDADRQDSLWLRVAAQAKWAKQEPR